MAGNKISTLSLRVLQVFPDAARPQRPYVACLQVEPAFHRNEFIRWPIHSSITPRKNMGLGTHGPKD